MLIDEDCGNLKVVVDAGELTRNINKKKKPVILKASRCPPFDKYTIDKYKNCFLNKFLEYCLVSMIFLGI